MQNDRRDPGAGLPMTVAVDVSEWPRLNPNRQAPIWWGIVGLLLVEGSVIAGFIASYFYLMLRSESWPPPGVEPSPLLYPSLSVLLLLASGATMLWAGKAMTRNQNGRFVLLIFASVGLASLTLLLRWLQFGEFTFQWNDHAYGSLMWTISGFHFTHVVSAVIGTAVIGILGMMRFFTPRRQIGVIVDTMYWNFVALAWLPYYLLLYWVPRIS